MQMDQSAKMQNYKVCLWARELEVGGLGGREHNRCYFNINLENTMSNLNQEKTRRPKHQ